MKGVRWMIVAVTLTAAVLLAAGPALAGGQPIKIGAMFISSGKVGGYGVHGCQAIKLAVDEINAAGGVLGRPLVAMCEDTKLKKDVVLGLAKKFVEKDKVDFLMGPTSSGLAMGLSQFAKDNKKILVLTQAAADALTGPKFHPYVFSTLSNAMMHARAGAYLMASLPYKRYMVVGPNYNYGHSSWKMFKDKLKELRPDVEFVGELFPKFLAKDFSAEIKKVNEIKPDAVWCPLWGGDAVTFIKQAKGTGMFKNIKFAFPCAGALEVLVPMGKDMPDGIYVSSRYFFTSPQSCLNRRFVKAYQAKYKQYPDYMAGETYAGVYFIKAAVERAGTTDADKVIAAVEKEPLAWNTPEGFKIMRGQDHQVVEDVLWGATAQNKKYGFSIPKNFIAVQGEEICRTDGELKAVRAGK